MEPNNLDQSIPRMDIIFLVAKICHTISFADFSSNNYGQGILYLEPGNGRKQAMQLFTHYTTCLMRTTRTASLQAITFLMIDQSQTEYDVSKLNKNCVTVKANEVTNSQNQNSTLVEFKDLL